MPDSPRYRDTGHGTHSSAERGPTAGIPRWVKISASVVLVLAALVVVVLLVGGGLGGHGPGRHY